MWGLGFVSRLLRCFGSGLFFGGLRGGQLGLRLQAFGGSGLSRQARSLHFFRQLGLFGAGLQGLRTLLGGARVLGIDGLATGARGIAVLVAAAIQGLR